MMDCHQHNERKGSRKLIQVNLISLYEIRDAEAMRQKQAKKAAELAEGKK
jgi:hypothetical protein